MQAFNLSGPSARQCYSADEMSAEGLRRGAAFGTVVQVPFPLLPNAPQQGITKSGHICCQESLGHPPATEFLYELLCFEQLLALPIPHQGF